MVNTAEKRLLELIRERAYRYSPEAPFQLASGRLSPHYVDLRALLCAPEALVATGAILFDRIKRFDGGVTTGSSTLRAIQAATEQGFEVVKVIVLMDRLEGGNEKLSNLGIPYEAIFTLGDIAAVPSRHPWAD